MGFQVSADVGLANVKMGQGAGLFRLFVQAFLENRETNVRTILELQEQGLERRHSNLDGELARLLGVSHIKGIDPGILPRTETDVLDEHATTFPATPFPASNRQGPDG